MYFREGRHKLSGSQKLRKSKPWFRTSASQLVPENRCDRHVEELCHDRKATGAHSVHPPLILLDLLKRDAKGSAKGSLRNAFGLAQLGNASASGEVGIGGVFLRRHRMGSA